MRVSRAGYCSGWEKLMRILPATIFAVAFAAATSTARAEDPKPASPGSSTALLAVGGSLTGIGVVTAATSPLCTLHAIRSSARPGCIGMSFAFGAAFLGAGIPMLVVGARRRSLPSVGVVPAVGGAMVTWTGTL